MTDEQIIKALECCYIGMGNMCSICPLCDFDDEHCEDELHRNAFDLINCQKAEIARLEQELEQTEQSADIIETILEEKNKDISDLIFKERSNAILEFAEGLKESADNYGCDEESVLVSDIDMLLKEMTEVQE